MPETCTYVGIKKVVVVIYTNYPKQILIPHKLLNEYNLNLMFIILHRSLKEIEL